MAGTCVEAASSGAARGPEGAAAAGNPLVDAGAAALESLFGRLAAHLADAQAVANALAQECCFQPATPWPQDRAQAQPGQACVVKVAGIVSLDAMCEAEEARSSGEEDRDVTLPRLWLRSLQDNGSGVAAPGGLSPSTRCSTWGSGLDELGKTDAPSGPMCRRRSSAAGADGQPMLKVVQEPTSCDEDDGLSMTGQEDTEAMDLDLRAVWQQRRKRRRSRGKSGSPRRGRFGMEEHADSSASMSTSMTEMPRSEVPTVIRWLEGKVVTTPSSTWRLCWELAGLAIIVWDLLVVPFQAFEPPSSTFLTVVSRITTAFWTVDLPRNFLVGYHRSGRVEKSIARIARRYVTTRFSFDLVLVCCDWSIVTAEYSHVQTDMQYMRLGRIVRLARVVTLLRLVKINGMLAVLFEQVRSETVRILLSIAKLVVWVMFVNHLIACGFYGISSFRTEEMDSWVTTFGVEDKSLFYKYATAYHWSLTQFTPASMEVVPRNECERFYTVLIVLFAMVTFSSFVSSLTIKMTELRNLNTSKLQRCSMLRRYLNENKVDTPLCGRIWAWVEQQPNRLRRRLHTEDVEILELLPRKLQGALEEAIFKPVLCTHPFFSNFGQTRKSEMRYLYSCLLEVSLDFGRELFACGQLAESMLFVISGSLTYAWSVHDDSFSHEYTSDISDFSLSDAVGAGDSEDGDLIAEAVGPGRCLCELALWFEKWQHTGSLVADENCEFIALDAARFVELMTIELQEVWETGTYARQVAQYLRGHRGAALDIFEPECLHSLVTMAFEERFLGPTASACGETSPEVRAAPRRHRTSIRKTPGLRRLSHTSAAAGVAPHSSVPLMHVSNVEPAPLRPRRHSVSMVRVSSGDGQGA